VNNWVHDQVVAVTRGSPSRIITDCRLSQERSIFAGEMYSTIGLDWIVQCFTSPPTQYRLYGIRRLSLCRMGRWSFWSWYDVSRPIFTMRVKQFLHFRSQWPWPLTFRPQICSPSYSCPELCLYYIRSFSGFPIWENRRHVTDGQTDWVQHLTRPPGRGRRECWPSGPHSLLSSLAI